MTWQRVRRCVVVQVAHFMLTAERPQSCMDRNVLSSSVERWGPHAQQNADGVEEGCLWLADTCSSGNWVLGYRGSWTICGPPDISETTTARKLNLKILFDIVKYPLWIQNLYTIQHEGGRHIDFWQMSIFRGRLRLTTARLLSVYMSLRALATTTTSSLFCVFYITSTSFWPVKLAFHFSRSMTFDL